MLYKYDMKISETNLVMDKTIEKGYFRFNFKPLFVLFCFFFQFFILCVALLSGFIWRSWCPALLLPAIVVAQGTYDKPLGMGLDSGL